MKLYWPKAQQKDPVPYDLHHGLMYTYDACYSLEECGDVFATWEMYYQYKFKEMWVEVEDTETGEKTKIIVERKYVPKEI